MYEHHQYGGSNIHLNESNRLSQEAYSQEGERKLQKNELIGWTDTFNPVPLFLLETDGFIPVRTRCIVIRILLIQFLLIGANQWAFAGFLKICRHIARPDTVVDFVVVMVTALLRR